MFIVNSCCFEWSGCAKFAITSSGFTCASVVPSTVRFVINWSLTVIIVEDISVLYTSCALAQLFLAACITTKGFANMATKGYCLNERLELTLVVNDNWENVGLRVEAATDSNCRLYTGIYEAWSQHLIGVGRAYAKLFGFDLQLVSFPVVVMFSDWLEPLEHLMMYDWFLLDLVQHGVKLCMVDPRTYVGPTMYEYDQVILTTAECTPCVSEDEFGDCDIMLI